MLLLRAGVRCLLMATSPPDMADLSGAVSARPPGAFCPDCGLPLVYRHTVVRTTGPRMARERWDVYACAECGPFELRNGQPSTDHR